MRTIRLREYGDPVLVRLTEVEATALQNSGAGVDIRFTRSPGSYEIKATNYVGTVVLPGRTVRIEPKVPVEHLLYLLGFAPETMKFSGVAAAARSQDLVEAMKTIYARALSHLLRKGLLREYNDKQDYLAAVRGRIDTKEMFQRRFGVFPPLPCQFQDYTVDNEANRRLLAAAVKLCRAGKRRDAASQTLFGLKARFEGVQTVRYSPEGMVPLKRNRLLERYEPALSIAEMVLSNASSEISVGSTRSVAFVVDMNKVFERFVTRSLRAELGLDTRHWRTHPNNLYLDEGKKFKLLPDVVWERPLDTPIVVLDTKYKVVGRAKREDAYQIVAYCASLGLRDAVLVYPDCDDAVHGVNNSGIKIHQWQLSLDGSIEEIQNEVKRTATRLEALADTVHRQRASSLTVGEGQHGQTSP